MMIIRKATEADLEAVVKIYDEVHIAEENGKATIGWKRGIYPVERTAQDSLNRGDLFVQEEDDKIVGTAIINKIQVDSYEKGDWEYPAEDDKVMVLHTLIISPSAGGQGYGKAFVEFYEDYAKANGCVSLRMDTNAKNQRAREMYRKLGYKEIGIVPTTFNGIEGVSLVLLEKSLL